MGLTPKQLRTVDYQCRLLFGAKGFEPTTLEAAKRLGQEYLWHEFRLPGHRSVLLTAQGRAAFEAICAELKSVELVAFTEPHDATNALRAVIGELLAEGQMPENATELVGLVTAHLQASCQTFWQVVPVHGLELEGVASIPLGCVTLEQPTIQRLEQRGAKFSGTSTLEDMIGPGPCLVGSVYGSEAFARREFKFRTEVVIGVLSAVAAVCFQDGATPFRITTESRAAGVRAARRGLSWQAEDPGVSWSRTVMEHQNLRIDAEMAAFLQQAPYVAHALALAARSDLSELERALIRGLFWFADAQQDTLRVMQLVKYWSCAEVIFSGDGTGITKAVSEGVAAVLVGGVQQEPPERYKSLVSELVTLYELRCKAVHDARHDHVSFQDVASLSRWTAWMLLGVAGLVREQGYTGAEEVRQQAVRLAGVYKRARLPHGQDRPDPTERN